jgi:hypothetical protein
MTDPNHGNYEGLSFAVAQVKGQNLYVGVEEYADYGLEAPVMCPEKCVWLYVRLQILYIGQPELHFMTAVRIMQISL